jgi:hypothetical protein
VPAPESIEAGLADGTYKHAHEPILSGGVDDFGEYVNVGYYVPFVYRRTFIRQAVGATSGDPSTPAAGIGVVSLGGPRECEIDGCDGLYPFGVRWEGFGELNTHTDGTPISYSDVKVVIQYRTPFYNWGGGYQDPFFLHSLSPDASENQLLLWATQEVDTRAEVVAAPTASTAAWNGGEFDGKLIGTNIKRAVRYQEVTVNFLRVPYLPRGLGFLYNTVNDRTFLGNSPGTVRFDGYRTEMRSWVGGIRTRSVALKFSIRAEAPWDHLLDPKLEWQIPWYFDDARPARHYTPIDMRQVLQLQFTAQAPI